MTDILQRLYQILPLLPKETKFLVPHNFNHVFYDSLKALGISSPDKIVICKHDERLELGKLLWSPPATYSGMDLPEALEWVSNNITSWSLKQKQKLSTNTYSKKIYISRQDSDKRQLINEHELCIFLHSEGFKICTLSNLALADQVNLFQVAEIIIAPHGAGLVNLMFTNKGSYVLELFGSNVPRGGTCYWSISCCRGLNYYYLTGQSETSTSEDSNFTISVEKVKEWIRNIAIN
ncbi:MAG: glycosyltransferase family 61 protein [Moorea sp. SIO1F2]|nr:glycosyltransferase family 61 protein [Moorena sp. SIO1F2]